MTRDAISASRGICASSLLLILSRLSGASSHLAPLHRCRVDGTAGRACWLQPPSVRYPSALIRLRGGGQARRSSMSSIENSGDKGGKRASELRVCRLSEAARSSPSPPTKQQHCIRLAVLSCRCFLVRHPDVVGIKGVVLERAWPSSASLGSNLCDQVDMQGAVKIGAAKSPGLTKASSLNRLSQS
jgi:hypothetical protein